MDIITGNVGWIEVICGPMFSGKSEELIRRLRRAMIARKRVEVFKPAIDDRYSKDEIVSHGDLRMKSQVVSHAGELRSASTGGRKWSGSMKPTSWVRNW
jgi:thymidine kinase